MALLVRDHYQVSLVPPITQYLRYNQFLRDIQDPKRSKSAPPSYQIFDLISNEIRNCVDHMGRSCDNPLLLDSHIEMAKWHLSLAHIRICMSVTDIIRFILSDLDQYFSIKKMNGLKPDQLIRRNQLEELYESALGEVSTWIPPLEETRPETLSPPSSAEMEAAKQIMSNLYIILQDYTDLEREVRASRNLPTMYAINAENKRYRRRRYYLASTLPILALIFAGVAQGAGRTLWEGYIHPLLKSFPWGLW